MFSAITQAAILRAVKEQGSSRCGGTFTPQYKPQTLDAIQRKLKKLRWPISVEELSWAYDVLGGSRGAVPNPSRRLFCIGIRLGRSRVWAVRTEKGLVVTIPQDRISPRVRTIRCRRGGNPCA